MKTKITLPTRLMLTCWNKKLKLFLVLATALLTGGLQAQTNPTTITTAGSGTYNLTTSGVGLMVVECWGGGGAGGSAQAIVATPNYVPRVLGGGGAGGSYAKTLFSNPAVNSYSYSVGAGGVPAVGANNSTPPSGFANDAVYNGASSTFTGPTSTVTAVGGLGGQSKIATDATLTIGIGGGNQSGGNSTATTPYYGGTGAAGSTSGGTQFFSGGGGGSAGATGHGGNASTLTGGAAGTDGGIVGANGVNNLTGYNFGTTGGNPGAGGSGAMFKPSSAMAGTTFKKGSNGGTGQIKITYYLMPTTPASAVNFTSVLTDAMTINWTNGNGTSRAAFVKQGTGTITAPVSGTVYTASTNWLSKGTELGTSGYYCVYSGNTGTSVSLSNLVPNTTYTVYIYEYNNSAELSTYEITGSNVASQATAAATSPTITLTGAITAFASTYFGDVREQSYLIEGASLNEAIVINAPAGFKVSKTSGTGFASSISFNQDGGGAVASQTVFVRFEPLAATTYSGNITHTSGLAQQKDIAVSGTGLNAVPTVIISSPVSNSMVVEGSNLTITATCVPTGSRTISATDVIFKYGTTTITGTVTKSGNDYSITTSTIPYGTQSITAVATDNQSPIANTTTSSAITVYVLKSYTGSKYAQSAITWSVGPWYDATSGGNPVTAPVAGDNVFTQGNAITITDDATCDNLTFTNAVGQVGIAAGKTLTVRGKVDCTATGTVNAFSTSDATSILKLTGETLSTPFLLVTENATSGMKPNNVIIEPTNTANTYQWGTSTAQYKHGTGAFTVAAGTKLSLKNQMYMSGGTNFHFVVGDGAVVTIDRPMREGSNLFSRMTKATINGSVIANDQFVVKEIILGTNGSLKTSKSTNTSAEVLTFDGWWGNGNFTAGSGTVAIFGTPAVLTFGSNSMVEFGLAGNQNINGVIPANTNATGYALINPVPYVNLKLSGSGTKTIQSNLTFTSTLTVASGVTLLIPSGVTLTVPVGATLTGASGSTLTVASGGAIVNNGTIAITPTVSVTPIDTYSYNGTPQGPVAATNSGSGTSYTFSYTGTGTTSYGPSATLPTNAGTYTATATVAADGYYVQASSTATAYKILSTDPVSAANTNISSLTLAPSSTITVSGGGSLVVNQNTTVSAVNVAAGGNLTVNTGVTLGGTVTLESTADATATLVDKYATPTQAAVVKQFVEAGRNWYVSAPISGAAYGTLDKGNSVVTFNEVTGLWDNVTSGTLTPGKGYIQVATAVQGTQGTLSFGGTANSGDITVTLSRTDTKGNGYNLVGNPYPSYLSWSKITKANTNVMSTAWFRTKKTVGAGGGYTFATVNAADTSNVVVVDNNANTTITKYIPPMQAYWVRLNADASTTNYTVNNAMRSHADNAANKMKAPKQNTQQLVRLRIANNENADDAVVYFNANASNNFDNYDSPKMFESASVIKPEIYTQVGAEKLVINGLSAIPYDTEIPVGYVTKQDGNYSIAATELLNIDSATKVLLKDKQNPSIETELTPATAYNFYAPITPASSNRFSLIFRAPGATTGVDNVTKPSAQVFVNAANQVVIIAADKSNYAIYNAVGMMLENGVTTSNYQTSNFKLNAGVYIVKVRENGNELTTRVIIK